MLVPLPLLRSVCAKVKTRKQKVTQYHLSLGLVKSFIENEVSVIESVKKGVKPSVGILLLFIFRIEKVRTLKMIDIDGEMGVIVEVAWFLKVSLSIIKHQNVVTQQRLFLKS